MAISGAGVSNFAYTTAGTASGVSAGTGVSGAGEAVTYSGGSIPANARVLEDGTTARVLEDGTTYRVTEP